MRNPAWFAAPLVTILLALAALHAYWALGGRWGIDYAIPVANGRRAINPGPLATWIVCGLLALAALIAAVRSGWIDPGPLTPLFHIGVWGLAIVFALRAIGEFRLVGFFKSITGTDFARLDSWLYSPLCLLIALLAAGLAVTSSGPNR